MKSILCIDVGNTNTVCGIYTNGTLVNTWRLSSDKVRTADEYYVLIRSLAGLVEVDCIAVSCVVPAIGRAIEHTINRYYQCNYIFVNGLTELGLSFPVDDPSFIGADLIVNAYSAWKKYQTNCIVCDFGTATTFQLTDKAGKFYGTAIMPGITTGAYKLFDSAALLSHIQLESPTVLLGQNTRDALLSGIVRGHSYSVDGFISEIKREFAHLGEIQTIATGGISSLIVEHSHCIDIVDKNLTLDGLYLVAANCFS